ncbi:Heterokaryon incompatibility protein 6- OR allele [Apiospora saccharicola]|uniref:Heterokaryon incompatibility protein 6- OR allele n=1 Tax=Apiospora saccharicola TaxID=335842 RepID=A0ABR1UWL1_9PEZI
MEWHEASCRRLDLVSIGGLSSCMSCGSFEEPCLSNDTICVAPNLSLSDVHDETPHHTPIRQKSETRILILHPGAFEDPICGDLLIVDLPSKQPYEALSYTWGDESGDSTPCRTIQLGGRPFHVTANCENALRRLRRISSPRYLWVDAICVDQNNTEEKGHQVQLMPNIYSGAQTVLVYVGEAADGSDEFLASIGADRLTADYPTARTVRPLNTFFARRYFHRVWVLQEVALARKAELICGTFSISWPSFKAGLGDWVKYAVYQPPVLEPDHRAYTDPRRLVDMMNLASRCECLDPRDKVYGTLGLFPHTAGRAIVPNYNLSVVEVYTSIAEYIASEFSWTVLFRLAFFRRSSRSDLPSWVPDWRHPPWDDEEGSANSKPATVERRESDSGLSVTISVIRKLAGSNKIDAPSGLEEPSSSLARRRPCYFLPDGGAPTPPGSFLMLDENSFLFKHFVPDYRSFSPEYPSPLQPYCSDFSFICPAPLGATRGGRFCLEYRDDVRFHDTSYFHRRRCLQVPVPGLLQYLREDDQRSTDLVASTLQHTKGYCKADSTLESLRLAATKLPQVDAELEALWPVPDSEYGTLVKQRHIGETSISNKRGAPRPPIKQISLEEFLYKASDLPDELWIDAEDYLLYASWVKEVTRWLAWKIILRMFLATEITAVIY